MEEGVDPMGGMFLSGKLIPWRELIPLRDLFLWRELISPMRVVYTKEGVDPSLLCYPFMQYKRKLLLTTNM